MKDLEIQEGEAEIPLRIRVAAVGAATATVEVAPNATMTVRQALSAANVSLKRDQAVTLNGNTVADLDQVVQAEPGTTPVIVVAPKVKNG